MGSLLGRGMLGILVTVVIWGSPIVGPLGAITGTISLPAGLAIAGSSTWLFLPVQWPSNSDRHHREVLRARHRGRAERPSEGGVKRVILGGERQQGTNAHASTQENHDGTREHHGGSGTRILPRVHRRLGPRGVQNDIEYLTTHQR